MQRRDAIMKAESEGIKKKNWAYAIILVIVSTFFAAFGQYFIKKGLNQISIFSLLALLGNFSLILGFFLYGIGAILVVTALRKGKLSVLYPLISLGFVWLALLAAFFLGEILSLANWLGIAIIILGITFVGMGGQSG
jgi:drug/metabolite transporter (DMT)-like permease